MRKVIRNDAEMLTTICAAVLDGIFLIGTYPALFDTSHVHSVYHDREDIFSARFILH